MPVSSLIIGECNLFDLLFCLSLSEGLQTEFKLGFLPKTVITIVSIMVSFERGYYFFLQALTWCPSNRSLMLWPCRKTSQQRNVDRWCWNSSDWMLVELYFEMKRQGRKWSLELEHWQLYFWITSMHAGPTAFNSNWAACFSTRICKNCRRHYSFFIFFPSNWLIPLIEEYNE